MERLTDGHACGKVYRDLSGPYKREVKVNRSDPVRTGTESSILRAQNGKPELSQNESLGPHCKYKAYRHI